METKILYEAKEVVPEEEYIIPIGKSNILLSGNDLTIAAYGYQILQVKKAISNLPYSIELIDLQSLDPLDMETILSSVSKTGNLLLVQEDYATCSLAEHIAYNVYNILSLKSKIKIISSKYVPIPFSPPLESFVLP